MNYKKPLISVIMPVYNCEKYVGEAIESILNQTYKDFEFIIIDDGSTDKTHEILEAYSNKDKRIKILKQKHSGIVAALNRGLKEAKGEWIARMDADDISLPYRLETQMEIAQGYPSTVLIGGWYAVINEEGRLLKVIKPPENHNELIDALMKYRTFFAHPTVLFKKDIVLKIGGYREKFRYAEDVDLWLRLSEFGDFKCVKKIILKLRKHALNISNLQNCLQTVRGIAARICHLHRRDGLIDLSEARDNKIWDEFLQWVEKRLNEERFFQKLELRNVLNNMLYSNNINFNLKKIINLLKVLINPLSLLDLFCFSKFRQRVLFRLAEESKKLDFLS